MQRHIKTVKRLTIAFLEGMTDAELEAATQGAQIDFSGFTDAEVEALRNDTAGPDLLDRVSAATVLKGSPA